MTEEPRTLAKAVKMLAVEAVDDAIGVMAVAEQSTGREQIREGLITTE